MIGSFAHETSPRAAALHLLTWTWCLPQTLVSAAALAIARADGASVEPLRGASLVRWKRLQGRGAVCLGPVVLAWPTCDEETALHEWGHFRQHLRLGPLYYVVIGIPSVLHAAWFRRAGLRGHLYFHFYTEAWADALGGVYARHAHRHARWTGYLRRPWEA